MWSLKYLPSIQDKIMKPQFGEGSSGGSTAEGKEPRRLENSAASDVLAPQAPRGIVFQLELWESSLQSGSPNKVLKGDPALGGSPLRSRKASTVGTHTSTAGHGSPFRKGSNPITSASGGHFGHRDSKLLVYQTMKAVSGSEIALRSYEQVIDAEPHGLCTLNLSIPTFV